MPLLNVKDFGVFLVSGNPGTGNVVISSPGTSASALYLPLSSANDGQLFDITIYSVDANGNPLSGAGVQIECQARSTFSWNSGTNSTFSRVAANVRDGNNGPGSLVNFSSGTQYVAVSAWNSQDALLSEVASPPLLHSSCGGL